jgi:hypothetical protein
MGGGGEKHGVDPLNGIVSCHDCNQYMDLGTHKREAKRELLASTANTTNDEVVQWSELVKLSLAEWKRQSHSNALRWRRESERRG